MQLLIMQLPKEVTGEDTILRHFMVFSDGQTWYQDELLIQRSSEIPESRRTDWNKLPTPPVTPPVVGLIDFGGLPLAMRADGSSYIFAKVVDEISPERWVPFLEKVPVPDTGSPPTEP